MNIRAASRLGDVDEIVRLASSGADLARPNNVGITPLHIAAEYGNVRLKTCHPGFAEDPLASGRRVSY